MKGLTIEATAKRRISRRGRRDPSDSRRYFPSEEREQASYPISHQYSAGNRAVARLVSRSQVSVRRSYDTVPMLEAGLQMDINNKDALPVPYMTSIERAAYTVSVHRGLLFRGGRPLDTSDGGGTETYIFVMDADGQIYAAAEDEVHHHSSFMGGSPVAAAGAMKVYNGQLARINNQSGHYRPTGHHQAQLIGELEKRRANLSMLDPSVLGGAPATRLSPGEFNAAWAFESGNFAKKDDWKSVDL